MFFLQLLLLMPYFMECRGMWNPRTLIPGHKLDTIKECQKIIKGQGSWQKLRNELEKLQALTESEFVANTFSNLENFKKFEKTLKDERKRMNRGRDDESDIPKFIDLEEITKNLSKHRIETFLLSMEQCKNREHFFGKDQQKEAEEICNVIMARINDLFTISTQSKKEHSVGLTNLKKLGTKGQTPGMKLEKKIDAYQEVKRVKIRIPIHKANELLNGLNEKGEISEHGKKLLENLEGENAVTYSKKFKRKLEKIDEEIDDQIGIKINLGDDEEPVSQKLKKKIPVNVMKNVMQLAKEMKIPIEIVQKKILPELATNEELYRDSEQIGQLMEKYRPKEGGKKVIWAMDYEVKEEEN